MLMGVFSCDYEDCQRKPYVECFSGENNSWFYFCFWHYLWARLTRKFKNEEKLGYCRVDSDRELMERIQADIWTIQEDLCAIKEKLKIKEKPIYHEEKPEEKGFA